MRAAVLVAFICLALVPAAGATEATIYPGVGIGKVRLGMTEKQVTHVLGRWSYVNERSRTHLSVGWGFAEWTIDLSRGRVVQIGTTIHAQRTPARIGTGSSWRALVRAYPHGLCTWNNNGQTSGPGPVEYLVPHKGGTQTIYLLAYPRPPSNDVTAQPPWRITEVWVREPWTPLPEFSKAWNLHCNDDWRTADAPVG